MTTARIANYQVGVAFGRRQPHLCAGGKERTMRLIGQCHQLGQLTGRQD